jgi:transposase
MIDAASAFDTSTMPDDPATLKVLLAAERKLRVELGDEVTRLKAIVAAFKRALFGRRSEKLDGDQLELALEETEQGFGEQRAKADAGDPSLKTARTARRRGNRGHLPAHLPRLEIVVEPESRACACCGGALHAIGEDVSERLDVVPAQFRVIVTRRPKYACRRCAEGIVQAPAPERLIAGGMPTEAMVAKVIVSKYADHLPLYRQAQIYARQGLALDRSTLADWVGHAAHELRPLHDRLVEILMGSAKLFADETRAPVLDPGRGRTKTGWLWTIARDDRPWGGADPPAVAYLYAEGRGAEHATRYLGGFLGVLQVDGYAAYGRLNGATLAYCWAHCRRKFYDIAEAGHAPIAEEALRRIGQLYAVEAEINGLDPEQRRAVRQERARPVVEELFPWLEGQLRHLAGKSRLAQAIRYALKHRDGLRRYLDDGRVEIDSNVVERAIRPVALNRKNALFAGSDTGAEHWAVLASLIETAKLNGINPHDYLTDVLERIVAGHRQSRIDELLPWNYPKTQV